MDRLGRQKRNSQFTREEYQITETKEYIRENQRRIQGIIRVGIVCLLLTVALTGSGCGRNQEQKQQNAVEPTGADDLENLQQKGDDQISDISDSEGEDKLPEGDSKNSENTRESDNTEDTKQDEDSLSIERIGEPDSYETEEGISLFISGLYYPLVSIPGNPEAADRINQVFEEQRKADEVLVAEYKEWAQSDYQERQTQGGMDFLNYALDRDYVVAFTGKRLLCLNEVEYSYMGGAHPNSSVLTWNFDLKTGEQVSWEQMTDDIEGFRIFLKERIVDFLEKEELSDGVIATELLYPDYKETLSRFLETPNWYVEGENLVIVFNQYDIAPYAAGLIAVELPLTDFTEYWNSYGQELLQPQENS